jgi:hypothetical protein
VIDFPRTGRKRECSSALFREVLEQTLKMRRGDTGGERRRQSRSHGAGPYVSRFGNMFSPAALKYRLMPGGNRPQRRMMNAVILPVSCCDTNASVRADI